MADNSREKLGGHGFLSPEEDAQTIDERQRETPDQPKAERYQVELVRLPVGTDASSLSTLQETVNKGARQRWRLVGVAQDPISQGVLVVWDTGKVISGYISG